jgi:phosphatidylethanolamine-binding protein (PEBP) family uncharacterized protein
MPRWEQSPIGSYMTSRQTVMACWRAWTLAQVPQGTNDMGHTGYDGPKPPKGHGPHRYHFRLAALHTASLVRTENLDPNAVKKAARSHVLAETELVGTFETP